RRSEMPCDLTVSASCTPYANPIGGSATVDTGAYLGLTPDGQFVVGYDDSVGQGVSWRLDHINRSAAPQRTSFWSLCGDHGFFVSASDGRDYMIVANCNNHPELWRVDVTNDIIGADGKPISPDAQRLMPNNKLLFTMTWADIPQVSGAGDWAFVGTY